MFDFPTSVASLDAVPEPYRALYAEQDGAFVLDETLAKKLDVSGLVSALDKERKSAREAERQLKSWSGLGASPEDVAARLGGGGDDGRLAAKDAEIARLREALEAQMIDAAAGAEIAAQRGAVALLLPHVRAGLRVVEEQGRFVLRVVDQAGEVRRDDRGQPLGLKELVAEMRQSENFARAFDGVGLTGSGMPPHGAGGGMPGATPLTREQAKDPAAYRRARDQAARMGSLVSIVE